ncbi:MAG: tetrahydrofolate dehydrogenase/cyclohydrolase catalytic domain-containing protein [Eubacteriales bacterium]|nr:tetrahydrofolate dehydrogenase/cyclohydrolase catalytic domain-containing protein [Eubacteriales bacterium]MDD4389529.1 tetrahydrofolate dehydrogenase/cyclohydrolase catalytic domain-containing protein [Eubacteriales bacterium]
MAKLLKGQETALSISEGLGARVAKLKENDVIPRLAIVRLGENPSDISYEKGAIKRAALTEVEAEVFQLPQETSQDELLGLISKLNDDENIHGILIFRPLPKHIDDKVVKNALNPQKDVDGITDLSLSGVFADSDVGFPPCTAQACIEILEYYGIDIKGKRIVVIGRSLVIGKPVAMLMMKRNATISVCHRSTKPQDLKDLCRSADIILAAAGAAKNFGKDLAVSGQIIIDVGINVDENGKLCGDVDFEAVEPLVEAITPVPGGVGSVTTAVLMKHVVEAAERQSRLI